MANTEGLPDEFVESLATAGSVPHSSFSSASRQNEQRLRARLRKNRLQERMDLPMSGSPAAKIIRASPNNNGKSRTNKPVLPEDEDASSSKVKYTAKALPLVGEVIEHKQNHNQARGGRNNARVSRFASRNRQSNDPANAPNASYDVIKQKHASGFPSVHNVPLGTFVKRKKKNSKSASRSTASTTPKATGVGLNSASVGNSNSHDLMKQASQKESDAMLADMSIEEIKDRQQEIEQALSPDLIAFLRQRRQKKSKVPNESQIPKPNTTAGSDADVSNNPHSPAMVDSQSTSITASSKNKKESDLKRMDEESVERVEKQRIANLVASIRTLEDLDTTYQMEMKGDDIDFDFEKKSANPDDNKKEEFMVACDLLRSSSPRQTLWAARTVSLKLEGLMKNAKQELQNSAIENEIVQTSLESTNQFKGIGGLPTVLPVSLRCLLDKPLVSSCNYLLHTYALQSLYYLTIIYAHPDHDAIEDNSTLQGCSGVSIFQEIFMDDAVPSPSLDTAYPPMSVRPLSDDEKSGPNSNNSSQAAAYMTSSSTTSALSDGEEFKKDPMWTLLSKMKIIPRLAFLLEHQQHLEAISSKAFTSICGIISLVGQRSPGAASAIMKHKTLTSLILKRTLQEIQRGRSENGKQITDETNYGSDEIVYSALRLFCILSRQSRVVAEDLPLEDILPPLLATGLASSHQQFLVQKNALYLWRTTLRYGIGLEALASMLTISARHFALPYFSEFSLSSDLLSSLALVLECVKVVRSKMSTAIEEGGSGETPITEITTTVVETATKMMASTLQTIVPKTLVSPKPNAIETAIRFRWNASRLYYLSNWFQLFDPTVSTNTHESIEDFIPSDYQETILLTLEAWAAPSGDLDKAWNIVANWGRSLLDFQDSSLGDTSMVKTEASASAFINAYFSIALVILRSRSPNPDIEDMKRSFHRLIVDKVIIGLKSALATSGVDSSSRDDLELPFSLGSARARWTNQCQFSVAKFCFHSISVGLVSTSSEISAVRGLVFALLGRLRKGDESIAAVLFSSDILFQTSGNPVQNNSDAAASSSSPISSMFLGEICGSQEARKQLDHSFKLQHGFGITSAGFGCFQLDSLLSNAELPNSAPSVSRDSPDEKSFPLGRLWLWQSLSGSIRMRDEAVTSGTKEAAEVIVAVLELILDLDETEEITKNGGYAGQIPTGSKLYYLMNVCLHHEEVLRDERVLNNGEILLDRYLRNFGRNDNDVVDFFQECLEHSGHSSEIGTKTDDDDDETLNGMDKKLLDKFSNAMTIDLQDSKISSEQLRAMVAFLEDLTAAYRDYGAQYDFFTKCIRIFLLPLFPSLIRCRGLRELESMLHLLTVSSESEDELEMAKLVSKSLTGGLPAIDKSIRDDNDILNTVAKAIASSSRSLEGYMRHYCIGTLVRNFAISLSMEQGVEISKKRLKRLGANTVHTVCRATELFLRGNEGTKAALVEAIISSSSFEYTADFNVMSEEEVIAQCLESCIAGEQKVSIQELI